MTVSRGLRIAVLSASLPLGIRAAESAPTPSTRDASPAAPETDFGIPSRLHAAPRLLLTDERLRELKKLYAGDPLLQRYVREALADAGEQRKKPALRHEIPDGLRLLAVSRDCLHRTLALAFAYRWTGERAYADAAIQNLRTVCAFPDWNAQRHFLDTAEMAAAVGIGYDWLRADMDAPTRETIRQGLIRHGLTPDPGWGVRAQNNWNPVCNGGLVVGSLAVADTDPRFAQAVIARALRNLPAAMKNYAPDGAWMEGPGYWNYATSYFAFLTAALDSALSDDFGLDQFPGLDKTGYFPTWLTGPSGHFLCFADAGSPDFNPPKKKHIRGEIPCLFWLALKYRNPDFSDAEHELLGRRKASALHVVWYQPPSGKPARRDLDRFFDGPVPIFLMRSSWDDPHALWCGVKAGYNQVPHGHLDLGNFEFEANGIRWAIDLGADDYNLPGYFGRQRWTYYRLIAESHNVPLIDGKGQLPDATATVLDRQANGETPSITLDLTPAYRDRAANVVRTVTLTERRSQLRVNDTFAFAKPAEVAWAMTTNAGIELRPDGAATLTRNGKTLTARILAPAGAVFSVASAEQEPPQKPNKGYRRLLVRYACPAGRTEFKIQFAPATPAPEADVPR